MDVIVVDLEFGGYLSWNNLCGDISSHQSEPIHPSLSLRIVHKSSRLTSSSFSSFSGFLFSAFGT